MFKQPITNLTLKQLQQELRDLGEPGFRFKQILSWIYQKRVDSFDGMRNISKELRQKLAETVTIEKLPIRYQLESKTKDAVKFGFAAGAEEDIIESVLIYGSKGRSLCISSQLGCALGCVFCETGKMGFIRNLTLHEITGQLIAANDYLATRSEKPVTNIIFMGMGEALTNFKTFLSSLEIIMHPECFGIGGRKVTVSTAGVIPSIEKLMAESLNINLAISLNACSNEKRSAVMPVNKKYPIEVLVKAAREYYRQTGSMVTFEYVLIHEENDTDEAAQELKKLFRNVPCKVNLIPLNPYTEGTLKAPSDVQLNRFAKQLADGGLQVTVRKSRGRDISGACGQLSGKKP